MKEPESKVKESEQHCKGELTQMLDDKNLMSNLIKLALLWCLVSFMYFLKNFLMKYIPGNIFFNTAAA